MWGKRSKSIFSVFLVVAIICLLSIYIYGHWQNGRISWKLTLTGKEGTKELTFYQIKEMSSYQGWGGFFTSVGVVNGPDKYKGVPVEDLCAQVGGISPKDCLWVFSPDGYSMVFSYEQVRGDFVAYDPQTLKEIPARGLKMLLGYEKNKTFFTEEEGKPLRIVLAGRQKLLTEGHYWVKWVNKIEVRPVKKGLREDEG
ncbi:MAG TPA: molybdopterin-binding oxidoreductase [Desulfotomaculum sp.]|jgi:hypothetical protein|nr:molybdopterin-binding oxidoreductase [Desulfotomaculum sp.]HCJ79108.1 molybdopterin-binding oxidoreductase [Desulfotomaculum sp.]